ncbi:MAG: hypothetical protein QOH30_999 [Baekduia sp.]|nr:hypothetical protein [Baekduia sp.]
MTATSLRAARLDVLAPLRWARAHVGLVALCAAVGAYYLWSVWSTGSPFTFGTTGPDYYNQLSTAFLHGHLYLPLQPDPHLLQLPNPYDPIANGPFRNAQGSHDLSLYKDHYYLYWGPTPALLAFIPFRLLPLGDLPQTLAIFVFSFVGFCCSVAVLRTLVRRFAPDAPRWMLGAAALALAAGNAIPFTERRASVYEVAITAGFCLTFVALYLLVSGLQGGVRPRRLAFASLALGLAVGARPTMIVPALGLVVIAAWLVRRTADPQLRRTYVLALLGPVAVAGAALAAYNAARFGSVLDFGQKYQLASYDPATKSPNQLAYVPPGVWYYLFARPHLTLGFPFVHLVPPPWSYPFTAPKQYDAIESIGGLLFLVPFTLMAFAVPFVLRAAVRRAALAMVAAAVAIILMTSFALWGATMRYEVDFASLLIVAAALGWIAWALSLRGRGRRLVAWGGAVLIAWGVLAGVAIGLQGYYNSLRGADPGTYLFLQRITSPLPTILTRLGGREPKLVDVYGPGLESDGDPGPGYKTLASAIYGPPVAPLELTVVSGSPQRVGLGIAAVPTTTQPPRGTRLRISTPDTGRVLDMPAKFDSTVVPLSLHRGVNRVILSATGGPKAQLRVEGVQLTKAPPEPGTARAAR